MWNQEMKLVFRSTCNQKATKTEKKQTCKDKTKSNTKKSVMNKFWGIAGASFRWKSFEGSQERAFDEEVLRDGRACIPKKNAMQLFNLWRLFCPEMQSCMERNCLCADIPIIFCDRNGRRRDTERYTGIHWDTRVSRCIPSPGYTGIHWDTRVSQCILVYPRVSP